MRKGAGISTPSLCTRGCGGMADAADLKSAAERREGSTPSTPTKRVTIPEEQLDRCCCNHIGGRTREVRAAYGGPGGASAARRRPSLRGSRGARRRSRARRPPPPLPIEQKILTDNRRGYAATGSGVEPRQLTWLRQSACDRSARSPISLGETPSDSKISRNCQVFSKGTRLQCIRHADALS